MLAERSEELGVPRRGLGSLVLTRGSQGLCVRGALGFKMLRLMLW